MSNSDTDPLLVASVWLTAIFAGAIILFWVAVIAGAIALFVGLIVWLLWVFGIWKKKSKAELELEETRAL